MFMEIVNITAKFSASRMLQVTCRSSNKGSTNLVLQKGPSRSGQTHYVPGKKHNVWVIEISKIYSYTMLYHVIPGKIGHTVIY